MLKWLKSLFGIKPKKSLRNAFAEDFPNSWGEKPFKSIFPIKESIPGVSEEAQEKAWEEYKKTKKRPRLYKQATVVTSGELPKGEDYAWPFPTTIVPPPKPKRKPTLKKATTRKEKTMPLKKSTSKAAFKENVAKEIKEGKKPPKQAVAIAYAVKREAAKSKAKKK